MRTQQKRAIGAALIFAPGVILGCSQQARLNAFLAWDRPAADGRLRFLLYIEADGWKYITREAPGDWIEQMRADSVHTQIDSLVEEAMRGERQGCPHRWLMGRMAPLRGGGVLLSGHCASAAELRAAHGSQFAIVPSES